MNAVAALAEQCEQAPGPSRELDREIWRCAVATEEQLASVEIGREAHGEREAEFRIDRMMDGLSYTASLDAAMTLVPEGWDWLRRDWATMDCVHVVALTDEKQWAEHISGSGKTPALALCAAALRARAAQ